MEDREIKFKELVNQNHERIYRICAYHTSGLDDCNDLYQQILINVWQALHSFRGDSKLSTWIYRIALNTAIDFNRAETRRMISKSKYQLDLGHSGPWGESAWEKIRMEKLVDHLWQQINQLSVIDKVIISLVLEEITSKEIADVVGISEINVRVKIHRIKESLKLNIGGTLYE
jgi:RNA polymerase sigma-70 factor, ECF subfamily